MSEEALPQNITEPGVPSPGIVRLFRRFVGPLVHLCHRPRFEGAEHLPTGRPYLLIANHSGGLAIAEINTFIASWLERFGEGRPIAGMAHVFGFKVWPLSRILRELGAIPSTREHTEATLAAGVPVLAFPGGDHEALRPLWKAYEVDFAGRKGFLRIARRMNVPVVPMGIRGSHFTAPILFRIPRPLTALFVIPWLAGAFRWSITVLGLLGVAAIEALGRDLGWPLQLFLSWAWLSSPFVFWPWVPSTIAMRIGEPIESAELFDEALDEDAMLQAAYERVVREVQALVDRPGASPP